MQTVVKRQRRSRYCYTSQKQISLFRDVSHSKYMCLLCHVPPLWSLTPLSRQHGPSETQWPLYVPPAWTLKTTFFTHRVYLCVSCDFQIKQLLFPQISLTGNGDAVCFCEYGTEFSNYLFIYPHLLLAVVDRSNDEVAWSPAEYGGSAAWIVCFVSCRLTFHRCVWHAKYNPLCSWELRHTFDTLSCCVSNTRLDRHKARALKPAHTVKCHTAQPQHEENMLSVIQREFGFYHGFLQSNWKEMK